MFFADVADCIFECQAFLPNKEQKKQKTGAQNANNSLCRPPVRSEVQPSFISSLARLFNYCVNGLLRWPR